MRQPHDLATSGHLSFEALGSELSRIALAGFLELSAPLNSATVPRPNCVSFALSELLEFHSPAGHLLVFSIGCLLRVRAIAEGPMLYLDRLLAKARSFA